MLALEGNSIDNEIFASFFSMNSVAKKSIFNITLPLCGKGYTTYGLLLFLTEMHIFDG